MLRRATPAREQVDVHQLRDNSTKAQEVRQQAKGREIHNQRLDDICYPQEGRRNA